jgi:hypothetical protein
VKKVAIHDLTPSSDSLDVDPEDQASNLGDRRVPFGDRRTQPRGGRRRADWPEDAGITGCTRCGHAHPTLVAIEGPDYRWYCRECRQFFVTQRARRVVL